MDWTAGGGAGERTDGGPRGRGREMVEGGPGDGWHESEGLRGPDDSIEIEATPLTPHSILKKADGFLE